jgi:hypothetical protein
MVPEARGHETLSVARSPIEELIGLYSVHKKTPEYEGFVLDTTDPWGTTVTVQDEPRSGNRVASTAAAPKSWWKSSETLASFNQAILWTKVEPKAVVSCSAADISKLTAAIAELKSAPLILML